MAADTASSTTRRNPPTSSSAPSGHDGRRVEGNAADRGTVRVGLPLVGEFALPASPDQLAFFGGVGLLTVTGLIEWPVAGVILVGHLLAANRNHQALHEFGESLEQA